MNLFSLRPVGLCGDVQPAIRVVVV